MSFFLTSTVSMLVVLGIMVLGHEFGHFAVAKLCGGRVEVFSVGFGKRLFGFRHGDTDYRLSLLPLGLAGPVSNFLLALLLMAGFYMIHNEGQAFRAEAANIDFVSDHTAAAT